ncbi:hypothetical protein GCM10012275_15610 [Longimycelium tulufanense]|uniref:Uncharacterized protein n=1 Tax=Longimycelium tulufanense TaxID=907463 RepID=A0A8J3CAQ6_9PSEU|nr:hypothetical protein GCM10012275_15610 [Longimycelium tulufanense]
MRSRWLTTPHLRLWTDPGRWRRSGEHLLAGPTLVEKPRAEKVATLVDRGTYWPTPTARRVAAPVPGPQTWRQGPGTARSGWAEPRSTNRGGRSTAATPRQDRTATAE